MTIKLNRELCYKTIVNERGHPHSTSVELLEDIIDHYQLELIANPDNSKQMILYSPLNEGWKVNYKFFKEKYNFGHAKIRYAFRKLEKYDLIVRKQVLKAYVPMKAQGGSEIYIKLNLEKIIKLLKL